MELLPGKRVVPPIDELYRIAKHYSRRKEEADDLVQDLLLEAVSTGKDFSDIRFLAWGRGFLRNRAAFIARTEGRRRKREGHFHPPDPDGNRPQLPESFIIRLRPTLRIVARLANCGLSRKEILYLLNIADTALRQRLTTLRREWKAHTEAMKQTSEPQEIPVQLLPRGLIRRSLLQASGKETGRNGDFPGRIVGSHDPDGHLFKIRAFSAHKKDAPGNNRDKNGK